jgi:glycosyltransferase involved in cell wall biosynthesis
MTCRRVLYTSYPRFGLDDGGLQRQVQETAKAISRKGVEVAWLDPWRNQLGEVDLLHVYSLDGSCLSHVQHASATGIPVVVSPVFNAMQGSWRWHRLRAVAAGRIPGAYTDLVRAREILACAKLVVCLNEPEAELIQKVFRVDYARIRIVPNGIDSRFSAASPQLFRDKYNLRPSDGFVLNVGRITNIKNQLMLIESARTGDIPLIIIGAPSPGQERYWKRCQDALGPNTRMLDPIDYDDPMLPSAYAAAAVFALPSRSEVMPLVLDEAASGGCTLVVSSNVPLRSEYLGNVFRVDSASVNGWSRALRSALEQSRQTGNRIPPVVYSWDRVGSDILRVYSEAES